MLKRCQFRKKWFYWSLSIFCGLLSFHWWRIVFLFCQGINEYLWLRFLWFQSYIFLWWEIWIYKCFRILWKKKSYFELWLENAFSAGFLHDNHVIGFYSVRLKLSDSQIFCNFCDVLILKMCSCLFLRFLFFRFIWIFVGVWSTKICFLIPRVQTSVKLVLFDNVM